MRNANGQRALKMMVLYERQTFLLFKADCTILKSIVDVNDVCNYKEFSVTFGQNFIQNLK